MVNKARVDYPFKENIFMPSDIYEDNNMYVIEMDLPGLKKDDIKVNYVNGYLNIEIFKKQEKKIIGKYIHKERFFGKIKRSFFIGKKKETDIKVNYDNGVLNIIFPIKY